MTKENNKIMSIQLIDNDWIIKKRFELLQNFLNIKTRTKLVEFLLKEKTNILNLK